MIADRELQLRAALVKAVADSPLGLPLAAQNVAFAKPTDGVTPWAAVYYMPNDPSVATLGEDGEDQIDGLLQVDLNYPLGQGEGPSLQAVGRLSAHLLAGTRVRYGDVEATILRCGARPGREDSGWWRTTVRIAWYARVPRN